MKRVLVALLTLAHILISVPAEGGFDYIPGELVVGFREGAEAGAVLSIKRQFSSGPVARIKHLDAYILRVDEQAGIEGLIGLLLGHPEVEYAEPNYIARSAATPDDPYYGMQWYLPRLKVPQAWAKHTGSIDVVVGVLDTGIEHSHPEFAGRIAGGYNFIDGNEYPEDDNGHGTFIAGLIGAEADNGIGIAGLNWHVTLMPVKVLDRFGAGAYSAVAAGIIFAADNGARVINLSLGGASWSRVLEEAVNYAHNLGCVLIASSGNENREGVYYPAAYANAVAVGALNEEDNRCDESDWGAGRGSNYGEELELAAPGNNIISTYLLGGYGWASGTSASAGLVSGAAALLIAANPRLSGPGVRRALVATAVPLAGGWNRYTGHGLVDVYEAVRFPAPEPPPGPWRWPVFTPPGEPYRWLGAPANN